MMAPFRGLATRRSPIVAMDDDLSADGPIAQRIRAELAAHVALPDNNFQVGDTTDARGLALYATAPIAGGTYLFDYGGALLQQAEFDARYPLGGARADYAVGMLCNNGSSVYIDAAEPEASNIARYMNHEARDPNVVAWTFAESMPGPRIMLFAAREVATGEELVWDYGDQYWEGRDDLIVADTTAARPWRLAWRRFLGRFGG